MVRKNSVSYPAGAFQGAQGPGPGLGPIQEVQGGGRGGGQGSAPHSRNTSPHDPHRAQTQPPPQNQLRQQKQQQFPAQHRYTLTDAGVAPGQQGGPQQQQQGGGSPGPGGRNSPLGVNRPMNRPGGPGRATSGGPPQGQQGYPQQQQGPPQGYGGPQQQQQPQPPRRTGPTTFAEMGIQAAKAEEKECIIM